jgi:hypothetical protein
MGIGTIRETVELFEQRDKRRGGLDDAFGFPQQAIHGLLHRRGFVQTRGAGKPFDLVDHDRVGNLQGHDEFLWADQYDQYTSAAHAAQSHLVGEAVAIHSAVRIPTPPGLATTEQVLEHMEGMPDLGPDARLIPIRHRRRRGNEGASSKQIMNTSMCYHRVLSKKDDRRVMMSRPSFSNAWGVFMQVNRPVKEVGKIIGGKLKSISIWAKRIQKKASQTHVRFA